MAQLAAFERPFNFLAQTVAVIGQMPRILVKITVQIRVLPFLVRHRPGSLKIMILRHQHLFWCFCERSPVFIAVFVSDCLLVTNPVDCFSRIFSVSRPFVTASWSLRLPIITLVFVALVIVVARPLVCA
ncbi:hypothetical protein Hdeb2414_s0846g00953581 [Helianthus debilis subsp. tardiflorus]